MITKKNNSLLLPILFIVVLFLPLMAFSQNKKISKKQFIADSLKILKHPVARLQLRIDNRTVFSAKQLINISGFDAGVILKEKLRVTLGYYSISSSNILSLDKSIGPIMYKANYQLNYGALNLEFVYKNARFFSLGMPVEFGLGQNRLKYKSTFDESDLSNKKSLVLLSYFGLSGLYKPMRWIGIKFSIGYKKTLLNQLTDVRFDGIYTSVGLAINFREIFTDVRMYSLKKRYRKNFDTIGTGVDLITD